MRYSRLNCLAGLLLIPACLGHAAQAAGPGGPAAGKPSVLLITIDTLRADHISPYGYSQGRTPNMEMLAREGALFENAYVQTPITLPSHASILTGTYPMYHKLQDVVGRLRDGVPTLANVFKVEGYATAAFVGSTVLSSRWNLNRGFDTYDDYFNIQEGLRQVDFDRIERTTDEVLAPALEWLKKNNSRPFFLWIHLFDPHDPYKPPPPYDTEFAKHPYDGEIAYVDAGLGKLFESMKSQGVYDETLIVFTSDHGESLGEHKELHHGFFIYDATLKVPLIFKFPDGSYKGKRLANKVRSVDIAPTILQYLRIQPPPSFQGESLLAMMAGKRGSVDLPIYSETYYPKVHFNWSPLFGLENRGHKYIEAPHRELYDTSADPQELSNILEANQALSNNLKAELQTFQGRYSTDVVEAKSAARQVDPETVARLKALGYVALAAAPAKNSSDESLPDPKVKIQVYNQLNRGIAFSRRGLSDQAVEVYSHIARNEPNMPIAHFLLGLEYFEQKLFLQAMQEFRETLKYNPDSNVAMFNLARSYLESGQTDQAETGFKYLIEREPGHFGAQHYLSLSYARRAKYAEALAAELKALAIRPDFVEGYNNLGSFYLHLDQVDKAIEAYEKGLSLNSDYLLLRLNLALAYNKTGAFDKALEQARKIISIDPKRPLAHYYLGQAYLGKGMKQEALAAFRIAKQLDPKLNVPKIS